MTQRLNACRLRHVPFGHIGVDLRVARKVDQVVGVKVRMGWLDGSGCLLRQIANARFFAFGIVGEKLTEDCRFVPGRGGQARAVEIEQMEGRTTHDARRRGEGNDPDIDVVGVTADHLGQMPKLPVQQGTAPSWLIHDAWECLAELAIGYEDLAYELGTGRRRLPRRAEP